MAVPCARPLQGHNDAMANILIGTCSWTDKSLIECKRFYPKGCTSAEERLRYYASQFPFVEVDSSYYAMPDPRNAQLWAERTPPGFVLKVKAFRALTQHQTPRRALPPDLATAIPDDGRANMYFKDLPDEIRAELWLRFLQAVQPLALAGKLGALHFQFPPWFQARRENFQYLERMREELAGFSVAIEFRHLSWFDERRCDATLAFLRAHGFVNVIVDEPQGFRAIAARVSRVHVPLNVNYEDQGIRAGRALFRHLGDAAVQPPPEPFPLEP